jgi:CRISP-associated protein Cas1
MKLDFPWLCVNGFGTHIKSTRHKLIIQKKNTIEEYPLESVTNLMIVGGHTINSATVSHLLKNGTFISFFEPNGTPVGIIRPFGSHGDDENQKLQRETSRHRYATEIAQGSTRSRIIYITGLSGIQENNLFYEGELQFLHNSLEEMAFLVKLEEIRRLNRLLTDMYYEILSRRIPPEFEFRRRTLSPQLDPVNAMLSFGYSLLFGNCCVSVIGARLDPDLGFLNESRGSLVLDLIEPLKSRMIDAVVFDYARQFLRTSDYEREPTRCLLSDDFISKLTHLFQRSINNKKIDEQVMNLKNSLSDNAEFRVQY